MSFFTVLNQCLEIPFQSPGKTTGEWSELEAVKAQTLKEITPGNGDWRVVDLRCSVEIKTPLVLYVEHQVSAIQELHNKEQMVLFANNQRREKSLTLLQPLMWWWCCYRGTSSLFPPLLSISLFHAPLRVHKAPTDLSSLVLHCKLKSCSCVLWVSRLKTHLNRLSDFALWQPSLFPHWG